MAQKKRWADLTPTTKVAVVIGGLIELVLSVVAAKDLRARPPAQVRGPKLLWYPLLVAQPFGPIAYLLLGRRSRSTT